MAIPPSYCTEDEAGAIRDAFGRMGWNFSHGTRTVLLAFAESSEVRDAVFAYLRQRAA